MERLDVFVPGRLRNPLNGSWGGWRKHARLARDWRERTAQRIFLAGSGRMTPAFLTAKKRVIFTAHVGRLWDSDNLPAALKPVRDGVAQHCCGGDDGPRSGHVFEYRQAVHQERGVAIHVEVLA
jgi:hypothetical protein